MTADQLALLARTPSHRASTTTARVIVFNAQHASPARARRQAAWLADQPTVTAPIASGRSVEQLADLLPMLDLVLTDEERAALTDASA